MKTDASGPDLDALFARFPEDRALIGRLVREDEGFRAVCEDHALALAARARFEADAQAQELADYRQLTAELEEEIATLLDAARPRRAGPG